MRTRHVIYIIFGILMLLASLGFPAFGGSRRIISKDGIEMWGPIVVGTAVIFGVVLLVNSLPVKGAILLVLGLIPTVFGVVAVGMTYPYEVPVGGALLALGGALVADAGIGVLLTHWRTRRKLRKAA